MALSSENYKNIYVGDNTTVEFPYTFKIQVAADLEVIRYTIATGAQEVLALDTDYTINHLTEEEDPDGQYDGINDDAGGTITLTEALADTYDLILRRKVSYKQETEWEQNGDFSTTVLENNLDKIHMILLQLKEQMDRAIVADPTQSTQVTLPIPVAGQVLAWGEDGKLTNVNSSATSEAAAALSAAAAAGSAATASGSAGSAATDADDAETARLAAVAAKNAAEAAQAALNLPAIEAGDAGKHLAVKGTADGFELVAAPAGLPAGVIHPYAGATAPTGYLLCNGAAVSLTTYAALYAVIGHTYAADPGGGNFTLPDLRGRIPVGKSTDTEFDTLGETGGEKTHQLSAAEMPSHTHTERSAVNTTGNADGADGWRGNTTNTNTASGSAGSDTAHNNLQPYITINYIIKT